MNGKGDKRRKGADDSAYRMNWERIFGGGDNHSSECPDDEDKTIHENERNENEQKKAY